MTYENQPENQPQSSLPTGQPSTSGLAIAALAIGILSMMFAVLIFPVGFVGGALGVILGFVALGKVKRGESSGRGLAVGGIVTSLLAMVIAVLVGFLFASFFDDFIDCADPELTQAEAEQCVRDQLGELEG
jgi:hypothetical protein